MLICSTDRKPDQARAFEVVIPAGTLVFTAQTKIDCRWPYTVERRYLGTSYGTLPTNLMADVDVALAVGLRLI